MRYKLTKLNDLVIIFESGGRPKGGGANEGIPSLGGEHINLDGKFKFESLKFVPTDYYERLKKGKIDKQDILIVKDGATTGKVAFIGEDFPFEKAAINEHIYRLKININLACPKYVYYFLFSKKGQNEILKDFRGATVGGITKRFAKLVEIPLPPIETQKKIADVLDKAQELIDKRKEQIEKLDEFIQSVFLDMFGDIKGKKKSISDICQINPSKSEIKNLDKNLEVTFLPMSNVSEKGKIDLTETRKISEVINGFTYFKEGDILFAKITPCMENGKGAIAKNLVNKIGFGSTEFHVLRPKENINSEWLYRLTISKSFRKLAEGYMTGSAGQKRVPKHFFNKFKVVVPPIELQNKFAEIVEKTEKQKELLQKSLNEMENNFNSLMQKAFKGELF